MAIPMRTAGIAEQPECGVQVRSAVGVAKAETGVGLGWELGLSWRFGIVKPTIGKPYSIYQHDFQKTSGLMIRPTFPASIFQNSNCDLRLTKNVLQVTGV
jgi:hypothetical protein